MPKYNFDDVEVPSFDPLPRGKYPLEVTDAEFKQSNSGNDMLSLELTVMEEHEEYAGRKVFHNLVFTDNSMGFVKAFLISLGADTATLSEIDFEEEVEEFVGMQLLAVVKVTKDQDGEPQNAISRTFPYEE